MLSSKVAVVTGASRGAGKGVALALGDAGATVYVTGRSSRTGPAVAAPLSNTGTRAPGTVEDTADEVSRRGGRGIPVVCDHTDDPQVAALFERVVAEQDGQLDLLVNAAWGGNELEMTLQPFLELPVREHWNNMFTAGVRAALTASQAAAAIMVPHGRGLIINVTSWDDDRYTGHLMYDLAKASLNRLAFGMAQELQQHEVACLAVAPGWMRTERVLDAFGCSPDTHLIYGSSSSSTASLDPAPAAAATSPSDIKPTPPGTTITTTAAAAKLWTEVPELAATETPMYLGRAVAALAAGDAQGALAASQAGRVLRVADLAVQYGFRDVDGRQPPKFVF